MLFDESVEITVSRYRNLLIERASDALRMARIDYRVYSTGVNQVSIRNSKKKKKARNTVLSADRLMATSLVLANRFNTCGCTLFVYLHQFRSLSPLLSSAATQLHTMH